MCLSMLQFANIINKRKITGFCVKNAIFDDFCNQWEIELEHSTTTACYFVERLSVGLIRGGYLSMAKNQRKVYCLSVTHPDDKHMA